MNISDSFHFLYLTEITSSHPCNDPQFSKKNYHCL